jgi:dihydrofolate reductase
VRRDANRRALARHHRRHGIPNSTILSGNPADEVRALKEQPGLDIVVTGSITLCHTLIEAGLVDEYRLLVYPVVQGRGRRLFPDGLRRAGPSPDPVTPGDRRRRATS